MRVRIFTNQVAGGWHADDIDQFLGGSEECVVLLSEALARSGYDVVVYHTFPMAAGYNRYNRNSVLYKKRELIDTKKDDILLTFKDRLPWARREREDVLARVHWSSEVEPPWKRHHVDNIDAFVCLSEFHAQRSPSIPEQKKKIIPHGIDHDALEWSACDKKYGTMLYCSSPDRGLLNLLSDWGKIKRAHPDLELRVAYGFQNLEKMSRNARAFKNQIFHRMTQPGITYLGQISKDEIDVEYWSAEYWVMPLQNPEAELFCLNAVKSRVCDCIPVVNKIGALRDTVDDYIPYNAFLHGSTDMIESPARYCADLSWDTVVDNYWVPLFESIISDEKENI